MSRPQSPQQLCGAVTWTWGSHTQLSHETCCFFSQPSPFSPAAEIPLVHIYWELSQLMHFKDQMGNWHVSPG